MSPAGADRQFMRNFYQLFTESASRYPNNIAVEIQREVRAGAAPAGESFTYAELRRLAESVGQWLQQQRLDPGARCAFLAANHPRWVAAYLGVLASGRVAVPLDTAFNAAQVRKLLLDSGASLIFTDERNLENARAAASDLGSRVVVLDASAAGALSFDEVVSAGPGSFTPAPADAGDLAVLLYTSGTTADPKGVMLTHDNLLAESDSVFRFVTLGPKDAILGVLPLFHALAQMANLLLPLAAGTRVVYLETLNTTELLRALRERDCTLFCCVPQFFYLIHERIMKQVAERGTLAQTAFRGMMALTRFGRILGLNLGKLFFRRAHEALGKRMRYLVTGGSRFDPAIGRDLQNMGFNVLQAYGLTETTGGAIATPPGENVLGSVGKPLANVEVKLLPYKSEGEAHSNGTGEGEIAISGRIVMKGYYNRPEATADVLRDGWLHTGDLGRFDERGNIFITGRKKDIIVLSSGKNIYPEEIEAHYLQSPWIREMCVMGLQSRPGEPFSERLHAVVVPDFDSLREKKIVNVNEVIRFDIETLSSKLPSTKRILSYDIWQSELPRTTTRKLKRHEIQRRVAEGGPNEAATASPAAELSAEDAEWMQHPDVARALARIRSAAKKNQDDLRPSHNLELDLGLDSMERVELLVALEHELGADVDEDTVSQIYTVRELVEAVRAAIGSGAKASFRGWDAVLAETPSEPEILDAIQPKPFLTRAWFLFGRLVNLFTRDLFHLEVTGLEKLPKDGPYIISPNHQSFLDAPILVATFPWNVYRKLFFVGTSEIFGAGPAKYLARSIKLVAVDPDANLVPAMRAGAFGLKRGNILVLFPEGERSIDGSPRTFKKGAAILSTHLRVPIVPVALDGFYEAWPRGASFFQRFTRMKIAVGDPLYPPEPGINPEQTYAAHTRELRARVMEMWDQLHDGAAPSDESHAAAAD